MKHIAVLDIGSSKVVGLCAERVGNDGMKVHGADIRSYAGYRFGEFIDENALRRAVTECLLATQRECGFRLKEVALSIPAVFTKIVLGKGILEFASHPKRITDADIDMLMNTSLPKEAPEGYALMHSTPYAYTLDGARRADISPQATAARVEADVSHVYVREAFLQPIREAIKSVNMQPDVCISAALAQSLMLIPEKARQKHAVLLDIGYMQTDVVVAVQSAIVAQETIESGGFHLASDLAYGCEVPLSAAEQVKRRYVFSLDYEDSVELIRTPQGTKGVDRAHIQYILEERAAELCYMIDESIRMLGLQDVQTVHLTGGGMAMMRGSREYLEEMLGVVVRKDMPWMPRMNSPNYSSVFGTAEFLLHAGDETALQPVDNGVLSRLKGFFVK